jgi:hypothetical protein
MIDETTDLDACFSTDDFGEEVEIASLDDPINAIFTKPTDATVNFGVEIEAQKPTLMVKSQDISGVNRGDEATVRSIVYTIEKIERMGTGVSVLYLKT